MCLIGGRQLHSRLRDEAFHTAISASRRRSPEGQPQVRFVHVSNLHRVDLTSVQDFLLKVRRTEVQGEEDTVLRAQTGLAQDFM